MRSPGELKKEIESRLKGYLSRDRDGIRHELLNLFVKVKSLTIPPQIYEKLQERFSVSYHSIASMVGIIASRIGILHVRRNAEGDELHLRVEGSVRGRGGEYPRGDIVPGNPTSFFSPPSTNMRDYHAERCWGGARSITGHICHRGCSIVCPPEETRLPGEHIL